jgi:S1-C subfamily serine protease
MRKGVTVSEQLEIIRFIKQSQKKQIVAALVVLGLVIVALFWPTPAPPQPVGIVIVQQSQGTGGASGILVGPQTVLTSANVVGNQHEVVVSFANGSSVSADVIFSDTTADTALLSLPSPISIAPMPLSDSDTVNVGDAMLIAGFPAGRYVEVPAKITTNTAGIFATDMNANPGDSGGALLRSDHTVVGLIGSTVEFGSSHASQTQWAIPINVVKKVCRDGGHPLE